MAVWRRKEGTAGPEPTEVPVLPAVPSVAEDPVSMGRFRRLIDASSRLREAGVSHEDIERRARRDGITFNEAVETLDRERSHA